ncbi:diacylglycerol/lipid kinase family protein [Alkaliphilus hydrothermalis]|uniref:Diacylglycerol kinase (ATP) n=1 Tax=Alkaliphilus hydrothermalis TaxID=1482730 RepID=A0ABS2NPH8_9FIRM|nr:YegS/Rv2252/BmrU family lipid kinase [Alkaliphilus hydrothermalis]MBM7614850.1 diacylglycerol kinase (ATP) [Alkaliphilus hydrothermalis]
MNRVKIIYNPDSGRRILQKNVPELKEILWEDYRIKADIEGTQGPLHAIEIAQESCKQGYTMIVAAGGDGTVNEVLNGMMHSGCHQNTSLVIYPAGTVNDLGNHFKISKNVHQFAHMIHLNRQQKMDVGFTGETYFLNVAAAGLLTDVAYKVSSESKTALGKFAYYLEGIKEFPKQIFKPIKVELKIGTKIEEKEIFFFILANTSHVGGFRHIAPEAKINDGLMDLLIIESCPLKDIASLFLLMLQGNHINHPYFKYYQVNELTIGGPSEIVVDVDGELGASLPMNFKVIKEAIKIIVPEAYFKING